jgi:probable DNA metabolism protein
MDELPPFEQEEEFYQTLWKQYFKSIAIEGRINPRLQMQHMPKKYWKYLIEK